MNKGLISNYMPEDDELIDKYDIITIAIELGLSPDIVDAWRSDRIDWVKAIMKVQANLVKGGK